MGVKKSLLLSIATAAVAMTAFAQSAMGATDGVLRDVSNQAFIANGTNLNFAGWAQFFTGQAGIRCHVSATYEATGTEGKTGDVKSFTVNTSSCHGFGTAYANCLVTTDTVENLPYHVTVTPTDFDVTGSIIIRGGLSPTPGTTCPFTFTDLFFEEITLKPYATGARPVTNTSNTLGNVVGANTPIAGVKIEGEGEAENDIAVLPVVAEGELELTSGRCTYEIKAS